MGDVPDAGKPQRRDPKRVCLLTIPHIPAALDFCFDVKIVLLYFATNKRLSLTRADLKLTVISQRFVELGCFSSGVNVCQEVLHFHLSVFAQFVPDKFIFTIIRR